ncbi:Conserved_hypothetical protein [Hexamita inflata]|uniref:Uncharacterized protein n=1 Tax=Hexamita inflata TaxID=28002 RepID=A0AA86R458_9EUKA|nr:Conserved hypothetical protein [Hexamita inflata]
MIGRADIEESKSHVALVAWRPQASYPCGNFSVTSRFIPRIVEDRQTTLSRLHTPLTHAIRQAFALLLCDRFPSCLSLFQDACVALQQARRPSQTPHLEMSPTSPRPKPGRLPGQQNNEQCQGVTCCGRPPLYALPPSPFYNSKLESSSTGSSCPAEGYTRPFPSLWFREDTTRDSKNLINPFMHVQNYWTRHLATLKESQLLPPFTRA